MDECVTINLPLKPYLLKYLTKKYGTHHVVSRKTWLGIHLIELLDKNFVKKPANKTKSIYKLIIPKKLSKETGSNISVDKYSGIEKIIFRLFRSEIFSYIDITMENGLLIDVSKKYFSKKEPIVHQQNAIQAMKQFLKSYNISEDDIKFESLYRDYLRYSEKNMTKNNPDKKKSA